MTRKQDRSTIDTNRWRNGTRFAVAERARFRCECCAKYLGLKGQADHITPRSQCDAVGLDPFDLKNLQWLCASCHSKKTNRERWAGHKPKARLRFNRVRVSGRDAFHAAIQTEMNGQSP